jgi:hypothetical protein
MKNGIAKTREGESMKNGEHVRRAKYAKYGETAGIWSATI